MSTQQISNSFVIEIGGRTVSDGIAVESIVVEDHLHLPDSFRIVFRDGSRTVIADTGATIGATVKVAVLSDAAPRPEQLICGAVTALEAELHGGSSFTIVRGYDQSHLLLRGRTTASYRNMTSADIAAKVARRAGLQVGTIDSTSPTHSHVAQANETDWELLGRLARDVGFEVTVGDGKLHFRRPGRTEGAPGRADLEQQEPLALLVGSNLLALNAVVTASEQVGEVEVRAWDPLAKRVMSSRASTSTSTADNASSPADVAGAFAGRPLVSASVPYATQAEVELAATSLAEEVGSAYTEMEGRARGNARLRAGVAVRVGLLGDPFDGRYVLTTTRHTYDPQDGYVTTFGISGRQERSLLNLTADGDGSTSLAGVVPAVVDDVDDPQHRCRVRLRMPWLADDYVTDWSRVAMAGAGSGRGLVVVPEVGDEVLVAFEQGDIRRPYVIGGLYNDDDVPTLAAGNDRLLDPSSKAVDQRLFTSRQGHQLVFIDADRDGGIKLHTGDGKVEVHLDASATKLAVTSGGDVTVKADGAISLDATGELTLRGSSITLDAQQQLKATGAQIAIEGSGTTAIKGQTVSLN